MFTHTEVDLPPGLVLHLPVLLVLAVLYSDLLLLLPLLFLVCPLMVVEGSNLAHPEDISLGSRKALDSSGADSPGPCLSHSCHLILWH